VLQLLAKAKQPQKIRKFRDDNRLSTKVSNCMAEVSNIAARDDGSVIPERECLTHLSLHDEQQFKI
jgi:hypothetical protein